MIEKINNFGRVVGIVIILIIILALTRESNMVITLDPDGKVSAYKNSWWGIKTEYYALKYTEDEWKYKKLSEEYLFFGIKKVKDTWNTLLNEEDTHEDLYNK